MPAGELSGLSPSSRRNPADRSAIRLSGGDRHRAHRGIWRLNRSDRSSIGRGSNVPNNLTHPRRSGHASSDQSDRKTDSGCVSSGGTRRRRLNGRALRGPRSSSGTSASGRVTVYVDPTTGNRACRTHKTCSMTLIGSLARTISSSVRPADQSVSSCSHLTGATDGSGGADHMGCDYANGRSDRGMRLLWQFTPAYPHSSKPS